MKENHLATQRTSRRARWTAVNVCRTPRAHRRAVRARIADNRGAPIASCGMRRNFALDLLAFVVHVHAPNVATTHKPIYPRTLVKNRLYSRGIRLPRLR